MSLFKQRACYALLHSQPKTCQLEVMSEYLNKQEFSDVTFVVEGMPGLCRTAIGALHLERNTLLQVMLSLVSQSLENEPDSNEFSKVRKLRRSHGQRQVQSYLEFATLGPFPMSGSGFGDFCVSTLWLLLIRSQSYIGVSQGPCNQRPADLRAPPEPQILGLGRLAGTTCWGST